MKILLDLDGWQRYHEVPNGTLVRGFYEVVFLPPPLTKLIDSDLKYIEGPSFVTVPFYHVGYTSDNTPIFKH